MKKLLILLAIVLIICLGLNACTDAPDLGQGTEPSLPGLDSPEKSSTEQSETHQNAASNTEVTPQETDRSNSDSNEAEASMTSEVVRPSDDSVETTQTARQTEDSGEDLDPKPTEPAHNSNTPTTDAPEESEEGGIETVDNYEVTVDGEIGIGGGN